jgi:hypothetical protein
MKLLLIQINFLVLLIGYFVLCFRDYQRTRDEGPHHAPQGLRSTRVRLIARLTKSEIASTARRLRRELDDEIKRVESDRP